MYQPNKNVIECICFLCIRYGTVRFEKVTVWLYLYGIDLRGNLYDSEAFLAPSTAYIHIQ